MDVRRPRWRELGLFLVVVAVPLVFTPFSAAPFMDAKLLLLATGALLVRLSGGPVDRRLAQFAFAWVIVYAVATLASVDPLSALTPTVSGGEGGLVVTLAAAALIVDGAGLPADLLRRVGRWIAWTGVAVAAVIVLDRLAPDVLAAASPRINFIGATMGSQLFAATFLAVAIAVVATDVEAPRARGVAQLGLMAFALAVTGERSSLVLPAIAVAVAVWRSRLGLRRAVTVAVVFIGCFGIWQVLDAHLPGERPQGTAVAQLGKTATDAARFAVWRGVAHAWSERPALGWGPNTSRAAYVWGATPEDLAIATRPWNDGHNLFLESGVGTGVLGLLPLLALVGTAVVRSLRSSPERAWAVGGAATIAAYAMVEPVTVVLTPLLFLFAGIAAGPARARLTRRGGEVTLRRMGAALSTIGLAAGVVIAALQLGGAVLQQRGLDYVDAGALRAAVRIQPWRLSAQEFLAIELALDARAGDQAAAEEARSLVADAVAARPWDPDVRSYAARVSTLLERPEDAARYLRDQLERFPSDVAFVADHQNAPVEADP